MLKTTLCVILDHDTLVQFIGTLSPVQRLNLARCAADTTSKTLLLGVALDAEARNRHVETS